MSFGHHIAHVLARRNYSSVTTVRKIPTLKDDTVEAFRQQAFELERPAVFPIGNFSSIPAISKWFQPFSNSSGDTETSLNVAHLQQFEDTLVPVELVLPGEDGNTLFRQTDRSLHQFVALTMDMQRTQKLSPGMYVAQCSLSRLPRELRDELPTPDIVTEAGRGDVYESSIWIGLAPTYTPLHKDPNPNLFVQLAGKKIVRLFEPQTGREIFEEAKRRSGSLGHESMRGEEMMQGQERRALEDLVWRYNPQDSWVHQHISEFTLEPGDAAFIPKGFWHSIKGVGSGIIGSVNWWFR